MIDFNKKHRIQLSGRELLKLRILLVGKYHCDRRNIYWEKQRIVHGNSDSRAYPIALRKKHLEETKKLLRKLSRRLDIKWFEQ